MKSGIYSIINKFNKKKYIGSSKNIKYRLTEHKRLLKNKMHHSNRLQNSYNKYGKDSFIFEIIEECEKEHLLIREQYYIDKLNPFFNICKIAGKCNGMIGKKHSNETKEKQRYARLNFIKNNPDFILKMSENTTGEKNGMFGKKQTPEFKAKRKIQMIEIWKNKEFRENQILKRKGKKMPDSFKEKMSGKNHPMYGKSGILSPNFGKKMSKNTMEKIRQSVIKPIIQIHKHSNEIIKEFDSIAEACKFYKINGNGNITNCAKGKLKTAYGYIWKYKN